MDRTKPAPTARGFLSRSEEVSAILRDEILLGQYRPGERLPSERDLTARFATSRGVVREAFKKLDQLGLASVQPGGARAVAVQNCTLDVLGPLLDLHAVPDPKLVDEVLEIFGVLMEVAARRAIHKATPADLGAALRIVEDMQANAEQDAGSHEAVRRLAGVFIDLADHLVLRLILNGLRTTFFGRLAELGLVPALDVEEYAAVALDLRHAIEGRDGAQVGRAMQQLNRLFRESAARALASVQPRAERSST